MMIFIRPLLLLFLAAVISACTAKASIPQQAHYCTDPRPRICTKIYMPACGYHSETVFKTYSNACVACSNPEVVAVTKKEKCPAE